MKKILLLFALALTSCTPPPSQPTEMKAVEITGRWQPTPDAYSFSYKGHKYITFGVGYQEAGVVHDPDCPCTNRK